MSLVGKGRILTCKAIAIHWEPFILVPNEISIIMAATIVELDFRR
jgi:hypothetical protein